MSEMAFQITSLTIGYSIVYSGVHQRKHQSSASLAFVWGIHRWPVNSPHKGPVTRKMFPFEDVIMWLVFHLFQSCRIYNKGTVLANIPMGPGDFTVSRVGSLLTDQGVIVTSQEGLLHDYVIKWKHLPRNWPFVRGIHRSPLNSPHKGQWRGALMFSFICAWTNDWVNNREAGDLRRHRAHYDVIVMTIIQVVRFLKCVSKHPLICMYIVL